MANKKDCSCGYWSQDQQTCLYHDHCIQDELARKAEQKVVTKKELLKIYDKCLGINKYLAHLPNFDILIFFLEELNIKIKK